MRLSVNRAGPVAMARSTSRRVVFALCALWCSTVTPVLAQHLNDTGQGNCHNATASTPASDPETAGFDSQNCTHEVAATVDAASAVSASSQASPRGMPEKPAGLDDAGWDSLQQAIRKAAPQQAKLSGHASLPGADGAAGDHFGYSVALDGDTVLVGAGYDDVGANVDQGSVYVFTRSGSSWTHTAKLTAGDGESGDQFGWSVALDGDTALVGAVYDDVNANSVGGTWYAQGSAYVFTRSGTTWTQAAKLIASDGQWEDEFGISVALDGDTALVGASGDWGNGSDRGSAYVFTRSGTTWTQQSKLTAGDGVGGDNFGNSVVLDGDTALVGARGDDVGANGGQGSAYVFTRSGATWTQQAKLTAGDGASGDQFGWSVALDGDTALVGAYLDDAGAISDQGSAYVFTHSGSTWTQEAKLTAGDGAEFDRFGNSVALDGDTALVGTDDGYQGSAYVFTRSGGTWTPERKLTAGDGETDDWFGYSVALDGDNALVAALGDDVGANSGQGSAYVFTRSGSAWTQQANLTAGEGVAYDYFGISVALDGDTALVGARGDEVGVNSGRGSAYVFTRSGSTWTQQAKLVADDGFDGDYFGWSVALDGDTALVGARGDDVGAICDEGSAYVFTRSGSTWTQEAKLTAGEFAWAYNLGSSVALDGDTALVGGDTSQHGSVYVFVRTGTNWTREAALTSGDGTGSDRFGIAVALDGDTALVGAYDDNVGANSYQGSAYVFTRSGSTWTHAAKLTAGDGASGDQFGWSVALDGDTALVGARGDEVGVNSDQGSAYVFIRSGSTWTQQAKLTSGDGASGDKFGWSVALDGDTAMVGMYPYTAGASIGQGSAYVFARSGSTWTQESKLVVGDGAASDLFGWSVAVSSTTALVGAPHADGLPPYGNPDEGAAYVFRIVRAMFANGFEEPARAVAVPRR